MKWGCDDEMNVKLYFQFQSTPLHLAAGYNRTRIVQLLLQHGADVHAKDKGQVLFFIYVLPWSSEAHLV